jgi:hypothetical protein
MLYSFCGMRLSERGWTLPWQLDDAHEPGPTYCGDTYVVLCAKAPQAHNKSRLVRKIKDCNFRSA